MVKIKKGFHYCWPFRVGLWWNKQIVAANVMFTPSCVYKLKPEKQKDINKIFGIRYLFGDHSARFGWRYEPETGDIKLLAYVHRNGVVTKAQNEVPLKSVRIGQKVKLQIEVTNTSYRFFIDNSFMYQMNKFHTHRLSMPCSPYFGGTEVAPTDIFIIVNYLA